MLDLNLELPAEVGELAKVHGSSPYGPTKKSMAYV